MGYIACYFVIGTLLVIMKTPIRELVDNEIRMMEIHYLVKGDEVPTSKFFLFRLSLSAVLIVIYPIMLCVKLRDRHKKRKEIDEIPEIVPESVLSWLQNEISIQNAEAKHMAEIDGKLIPFGCINKQWQCIVGGMQDGDRFYEFRSSDESWECLAGREGIALVRDGNIIADIITEMN